MALVFFTLSPIYHFTHCSKLEFQSYTTIEKFLYLQLAGFVVRSKFYAVWKLSEASSSLTGISFNGYDANKTPIFNASENVNVYNIEFAQNMKMLTDSWNKYTNLWLKHTIYTRVNYGSTFATYLGSAFWHGFHPGYYLTFVSAALVTASARIVRRHLRPLFIQKSSKLLYDYAGTIVTLVIANYFFMPFIVKDFETSLYIWKQVYFFGHFMTLMAILIPQVWSLRNRT
jgi:lysophospholipid acyltransferase